MPPRTTDMKHSIQVPTWMWEWAKTNDPHERKNPASYLRDFLSQAIMERSSDDRSEEEETTEIQGISEESRRIAMLLANDGLMPIDISRAEAVARKDGPCVIENLELKRRGIFNSPNVKGRNIIMVCFSRDDRSMWLPVLPKYRKNIEEILRDCITNSQGE